MYFYLLLTMIFDDKQKEEAHAFYREALGLLKESGTPFMLGGAFAMFHYTGIYRDTKDLDVFCTYDEYSKILTFFADKGYKTELTDIRWLAKVFKGDYFIDIIFNSPNNICRVDATWYEHATRAEFMGHDLLLLPAEELIWCKSYVQNRERYDGADVNHVILKTGKDLDWKRLLERMHFHWHILLSHLLLFQFVYPADFPGIIPKWLFDDLINRAINQYKLPAMVEKVCLGPVIDQTQYGIDIKEWDYKALTLKSV
jgi:hypothetical protein